MTLKSPVELQKGGEGYVYHFHLANSDVAFDKCLISRNMNNVPKYVLSGVTDSLQK